MPLDRINPRELSNCGMNGVPPYLNRRVIGLKSFADIASLHLCPQFPDILHEQETQGGGRPTNPVSTPCHYRARRSCPRLLTVPPPANADEQPKVHIFDGYGGGIVVERRGDRRVWSILGLWTDEEVYFGGLAGTLFSSASIFCQPQRLRTQQATNFENRLRRMPLNLQQINQLLSQVEFTEK